MCDTVFAITSQKRITLRAKFSEPEMTKFSATGFFKIKTFLCPWLWPWTFIYAPVIEETVTSKVLETECHWKNHRTIE